MQCKGDQLCNKLWNHYDRGVGGTYYLSDEEMAHVAQVAQTVKKGWRTIGPTDWNDHQATQVQVRFYGTKLEWALGTATLYFASDGLAVGFRDNFDFDKKCWNCAEGRNSWKAELLTRATRFGVSAKATPFFIRY